MALSKKYGVRKSFIISPASKIWDTVQWGQTTVPVNPWVVVWAAIGIYKVSSNGAVDPKQHVMITWIKPNASQTKWLYRPGNTHMLIAGILSSSACDWGSWEASKSSNASHSVMHWPLYAFAVNRTSPLALHTSCAWSSQGWKFLKSQSYHNFAESMKDRHEKS